MDFGHQMRIVRITRGLSQKQLQELTGIDARYLSEIETGKILPNPDWKVRLKKALDWPEQGDEAFAILTGEAENNPT